MRKLLILMLVFGMAPLANAAMVISINGNTAIDAITIAPSEVVTIDVYDPIGGDYLVYLDFLDKGSFTLSNPTAGPAIGDLPGSFRGPYDLFPLTGQDGEEVEITEAWAVGTTPFPGVVFEIDLHCDVAGSPVTVELLDGFSFQVIDSATIHQIPEPATLVLLGLGGLLLRRRK